MILCSLFALAFMGCEKQDMTEKTFAVQMMYNGDNEYVWHLQNMDALKMVKVISEERAPGAFEETQLGNPHTQIFTFQLVDGSIESETVTFQYKHVKEAAEPHFEGEKVIELKAIDFK